MADATVQSSEILANALLVLPVLKWDLPGLDSGGLALQLLG